MLSFLWLLTRATLLGTNRTTTWLQGGVKFSGQPNELFSVCPFYPSLILQNSQFHPAIQPVGFRGIIFRERGSAAKCFCLHPALINAL